MCYQCWEESVGDAGPDYPENSHLVVQLIHLLYEFGEGSSPLHMVIENSNVRDRDIEYVRNPETNTALKNYDKPTGLVALAVAELLAPMTIRQRASVIDWFYLDHHGISAQADYEKRKAEMN